MILQCLSHMLLIFSLLECVYDVFIVKIYFLFQKSACYHIFSQIKNWFASSLDVDLNFSQIKNRFASSLDAEMNFSQSKKLICIFIRCRFEFFSNQKLICIFLRYKSDFFNICKFWNKGKDYAWMCLLLFVVFSPCCINLSYEWNSILKKTFFIFF